MDSKSSHYILFKHLIIIMDMGTVISWSLLRAMMMMYYMKIDKSDVFMYIVQAKYQFGKRTLVVLLLLYKIPRR